MAACLVQERKCTARRRHRGRCTACEAIYAVTHFGVPVRERALHAGTDQLCVRLTALASLSIHQPLQYYGQAERTCQSAHHRAAKRVAARGQHRRWRPRGLLSSNEALVAGQRRGVQRGPLPKVCAAHVSITPDGGHTHSFAYAHTTACTFVQKSTLSLPAQSTLTPHSPRPLHAHPLSAHRCARFLTGFTPHCRYDHKLDVVQMHGPDFWPWQRARCDAEAPDSSTSAKRREPHAFQFNLFLVVVFAIPAICWQRVVTRQICTHSRVHTIDPWVGSGFCSHSALLSASFLLLFLHNAQQLSESGLSSCF